MGRGAGGTARKQPRTKARGVWWDGGRRYDEACPTRSPLGGERVAGQRRRWREGACVASEERVAAGVPGGSPAGGGWAWTVRALRSRNYRLFFGGQGISLIGTWMQSVALSWLVYGRTGSVLLLGEVAFASQLPILLLSPVAGVFADRWDLRRTLVATQSLMALQALLLAILTLTGVIQVWQIVVLSVMAGVLNACDMPARQAFVVQMVARPEDLSNAIALNSFLFNGARLVGPSLAGLVVAAIGEGPCFLLNAASFGAVILALVGMALAPRPSRRADGSVLHGLREGFGYAFGSRPIRLVLGLLSLVSLTGMSYATLMPVFAKDILGGGPSTYGFLLGATGVGAVLAVLYLAWRPSVAGLWRVIPLGAGTFGIGLIALSRVQALWQALPLLVLTGLGMMLQIASSNTIIQTIVDEDKRGRVMSIYAMSFIGMAPFGSLLITSLAHRIDVSWTLVAAGGCCLLGALLFASRLPAVQRLVQPVDARKGNVPEGSGMAEGHPGAEGLRT